MGAYPSSKPFTCADPCTVTYTHNRELGLYFGGIFCPLLVWSVSSFSSGQKTLEPPSDKTNKMTCAASKDSDYPGHLPSLIRVFAVHSMGS